MSQINRNLQSLRSRVNNKRCTVIKGYKLLDVNQVINDEPTMTINNDEPALNTPDITDECMSNIIADAYSTSIDDFLSATMTEVDDGLELLDVVYKEYKLWHEDNNTTTRLSKNDFIEKLQCMGHDVRAVGSERRKTRIAIIGKQLIRKSKDKKYINLWRYWNIQYVIGHHNGKNPYCISDGPEWENINITYSNNAKLKPIYRMINMDGNFICCVRANCGTGKTVGLKPYILARILQKKDLRVLIVGNRITIDNKYFNEYEILGF